MKRETVGVTRTILKMLEMCNEFVKKIYFAILDAYYLVDFGKRSN